MSHHTNNAFVSDENISNKNGYKNEENVIKSSHQIELSNFNKAKESAGDYDPYLHREVDHPTTYFDTLLHFLKGCLGTGILAMPKAFYHSGYLIGLFATVIIGGICTYCVHMLLRAHYELCTRYKVPSMTYNEIAQKSFKEGPAASQKMATFAKHTVNLFLFVYQIGICCVYVVFIGTNVKSVCDVYLPEMSVSIYMLIFLLPLILINWVRNLKKLVPICTAGNIITLIGYTIIFYYIIKQEPNFEGKAPSGKYEDFPLFFGTVLFSLEAIGVILPLENEMKKPKQFAMPCGVLNIGISGVIIIYAIMGLLGYLSYGEGVESSITLNLPKDDILAQIVKLTLALSIYFTYTLQCYVAVDISWNEYIGPKITKNSNHALFWEYFLRTVIVIITFLLGVAVPELDLFISLFGALCLSMAGIALPAVIDVFTFWYSREGISFYLSLAKNSLLILFGMAGLVAGTYTSLKEIIDRFN